MSCFYRSDAALLEAFNLPDLYSFEPFDPDEFEFPKIETVQQPQVDNACNCFDCCNKEAAAARPQATSYSLRKRPRVLYREIEEGDDETANAAIHVEEQAISSPLKKEKETPLAFADLAVSFVYAPIAAPAPVSVSHVRQRIPEKTAKEWLAERPGMICEYEFIAPYNLRLCCILSLGHCVRRHTTMHVRDSNAGFRELLMYNQDQVKSLCEWMIDRLSVRLSALHDSFKVTELVALFCKGIRVKDADTHAYSRCLAGLLYQPQLVGLTRAEIVALYPTMRDFMAWLDLTVPCKFSRKSRSMV